MTWLLWTCLAALVLLMLLRGVSDKEQRIQFPFLAGVVLSYHVVLPLYTLVLQQDSKPVPALDSLIFMSLLCVGAGWAGYLTRWRVRWFAGWRFDRRRLAMGASMLVLCGAGSAFSMGHIDVERTTEGQMTGAATILLFLIYAARFGFVIACLLFIRTRQKWLFLLMVPQFYIYLSQILLVRRSAMGDLAVAAILLLFFARRWIPPLWMMALGAALFAVLHFNVSVLRSSIGRPLEERMEILMESDPLEALDIEEITDEQSVSIEFQNAAFFMEGVTQTGEYSYGRHFWNQLVFGWVPAQIVGRDFKASLQFDLNDQAQVVGYQKPFGTCETGIAEAYRTFWYLGAGIFFVIGGWLRFLWDHARAGSLIHQAFLVLSMFGACMTFSAQIWTYVNFVVQIFVFTVPVFWWARVRPGLVSPRPANGRPVPRRPSLGGRSPSPARQ